MTNTEILEKRLKEIEWKFSGHIWKTWEHRLSVCEMHPPHQRFVASGEDKPVQGDLIFSGSMNVGSVTNRKVGIFLVEKAGIDVVRPSWGPFEDYCVDCLLYGFLDDVLESYQKHRAARPSSL